MEPLYSDNDLAGMFEPERTRVGLAILVTEMRNRYEADRDALRARVQELEAAVDPEVLTIAYQKGYADALAKARVPVEVAETIKLLLTFARFDPLWRSGQMTRSDAYTWLAEQLGIALDKCHIGMFDAGQCQRVIDVVEARNNDEIH